MSVLPRLNIMSSHADGMINNYFTETLLIYNPTVLHSKLHNPAEAYVHEKRLRLPPTR
jgi:hypothetical protein